jgi:hypothetical protein
MKKVKVMMTSAVILLAVGGAFASKFRAYNVYTQLGDMYPLQTAECQIRGTCTGTGALCRVIVASVPYQLYHTGCVTPANGVFVP